MPTSRSYYNWVEIVSVIIVGVFIILAIGEYMPQNVVIMESASDRATTVIITLERSYDDAPRSKVLKDAIRELQKELSEQTYREK